jgi:flagellar motility protein MotE (MotC chaperone)
METSPIEVQKALKGMDYPAKKKDLIEKARENDAPQEVMHVLENLPDKEFENAVDVSREFGEGGGGRGGHQGGSSRGGHQGGGSRGSQEQEGQGISHRGAGSPPIEAQKALKGMDYPARKQEILEKARDNNATKEVMDILEDLPDKEYENAADVSKEFGGETGNIEEREGRGGQKQGGRGHKKEE